LLAATTTTTINQSAKLSPPFSLGAGVASTLWQRRVGTPSNFTDKHNRCRLLLRGALVEVEVEEAVAAATPLLLLLLLLMPPLPMRTRR
jgi:hypothetical protein